MATTSKLTETTRAMRKYIIGFLAFAIVVILVQNIYHYIQNRNSDSTITNSPYAYVDEAFGTIAYPTIPSLAIADGSNPSYSVSGQFSNTLTSVNVYKVNKPKITLSSVSNGENLAQLFGIETDYQTSENTLTWQTASGKNLVYDKLSQAATYKNLSIDLNILRANKPETIDIKSIEDSIDNTRSNLLSDANLSQIPTTEDSKLSYLLASGKAFQTTTNTENADYIRKDYYPQYEIVSLKSTTLETGGTIGEDSTSINTSDIQAILGRLFRNNPNEGTTNLTYANSTQVLSQTEQLSTQNNELSKIREFNKIGYEVNQDEKATYSVISVEQAWENVKDGKGSLRYLVKQGGDPLAEYNPLNVKRFILNPDDCKLGFYITEDWTGYVYPIYILKGTAELQDGTAADFVFYIKAIADN